MATRNLSIRLALENQAQVARGLEAVGSSGQAALKKIESASSPASRGLLALNDASRSLRGGIAALGFGAAATGLAMLAKRSIDASDAMNDMRLKTGLAFKELAAFELIAKKSGTTLDGVAGSIKFLQRYMIEHGDKLRAIGVTATDTNQAMAQFADIVSGVQDPALRTALAMEVLGRGGADMIPVLMGGSDALRQAAEASAGYGAALEKSGPMADEFNDLAAESGTVLKQFREEVLVLLLPVMQDFLKYFKDGADGVDGLSSAAIAGADALKVTGAVLAYMALGAETAARSVMLLGEALSLRLSGEWELANQANINYGNAIAAAAERTNKFIEILNRERPAVEAVTNEIAKGGKAYDAHIASRDAGLKKILEGGEAEKKAAKELAKARQEEADWLFRITGLIEKDVAEWEKKNALLPDYIRDLEQESRLAGLTADGREEELAVIKAMELAVHGLSEADEARIRAIVRATNAQEAGIEAAKKAAEESARAWEKATDRLKDSISDSIFRGFENGESAAKIFFDTIRRTALTSLIQIPVNFAVDAGAGLLRGALGMGGQGGAGGGGGGIGGALNAGSSLFSAGNLLSGGALTSGISGALFGTAGVGVAAGAQGAVLPATAGLLGTGGFSAAYPTLAAAGPYAAAAAAVFTIARMSGLIGPGKSVGPNAGAQLIESGGVFSVGPSGADNGGNTAGVIAEVSQAVEVLNALAMGIGVAQIGDGIASYIDTFKAGGIGNAADLIKDAISKGVIEGLTEAERALISSSSDIGATAQRIIENRLLPQQLAAQRLQLEDPAKFARDAAKAERDGMIARLREIESGAQALADVEFIYQRNLSDIQKQFATSVGDAFSTAIELAGLRLSAANDNVNRASAVLQKAVAAERDAATTRYNAAVKASQKALDGLTQSASRLSGIASLLKGAIPGIPGMEGPSRIAGQNTLSAALAAVRAGGVLPDEDALRDALDAVAKPSEGLFSTFLEYQTDFIRTANDIRNLYDVADWQRKKADLSVTTAQDMLEQDRLAYEAELTRLDGILTGAQDQIDAVNGTTLAVMSVENAIKALAAALGASRAAGTAAATANPVPGLYNALLGRAPDKAGEAFYNNEIASGRATANDVALSVVSSPEFAAVAAPGGVEGLYQTLLGRAPDAAGLAYWQNAQSAGMSLGDIAANFIRDAEYQTLHPRAAGGPFMAGQTLLVGEQGPEIMRMGGNGYVSSNSDSKRMLDNSAVVAELKQMRMELNAALIAVAKNTASMEYFNRKWDTDGMPPVRAA